MTLGEVSDYQKFTRRAIYRLALAQQITALGAVGNLQFSKAGIEACIKDHNALKKANEP